MALFFIFTFLIEESNIYLYLLEIEHKLNKFIIIKYLVLNHTLLKSEE
jgi:hypothetical protein